MSSNDLKFWSKFERGGKNIGQRCVEFENFRISYGVAPTDFIITKSTHMHKVKVINLSILFHFWYGTQLSRM